MKATAVRKPRYRNWGVSISLLALPLLVYSLFMLYPLGRVLLLSLYEWDGMGEGVWAGASNYQQIFSDPRLAASFGHALVLIVFFTVFPLIIGLVLASLLVNSKARGLGFFRTVVLLRSPWWAH